MSLLKAEGGWLLEPIPTTAKRWSYLFYCICSPSVGTGHKGNFRNVSDPRQINSALDPRSFTKKWIRIRTYRIPQGKKQTKPNSFFKKDLDPYLEKKTRIASSQGTCIFCLRGILSFHANFLTIRRNNMIKLYRLCYLAVHGVEVSSFL